MSNSQTRRKSSLAVFEKISPNSSKPRNKKIRRLTPHCVAGNLTIESTLGLSNFMTASSNGASCNYAIGSDGRIGLGVEETNRAWTSSSATNDNEAITYEIANNGGSPDWRMSDEAINAWMDIAVETAIFYGFKKFNYQEKPSNISGSSAVESWIASWANSDEMIITLHNWYAAKACPGPYFTRQLPWIVKELNKRLDGSTPNAFVGEGTSPPKQESEDNISIIWNFFKNKNLNPYAIAGIMGNLYAESGLRPNNLQNSFETSLNMSDKIYTQSIDDGSYTNFVQDKAGYGLAQWTYPTRKQALLDFAKTSNTSIEDLNMQLNFMWEEMQNSYKSMLDALSNINSIYNASTIVLLEYEKPADQTDTVRKKRAEYSQGYFDKFSQESTSSSIPYKIKITVNALNVRKGPGTYNSIVKTLVNDKNIYTIVEEADGPGAKKWGRLKSGIGWLALDYTSKQFIQT